MRIDKRLIDALPKGTLSMLMKLPRAQGRARLDPAGLRHPARRSSSTSASTASSTRATPSARWPTADIAVPELDTYATKLWDYWERDLDPDLYKDRSFEHARQRQDGGHHRRLVGHRPGGGAQDRARRRHPDPGRALDGQARGGPRGDRGQRAARPTPTAADLSALDSIDDLVEQRPGRPSRRSTCWSTTPGRSIRRSIALSHDRFHDFERTVQLNYLGTIKLTMGLLPHMRERRSGHVVNVSLDRRADQPAALQRLRRLEGRAGRVDARRRPRRSSATTSRSRRSTCRLVRTPMIAPTKIYDSFPTISPDEAGDIICEAIRSKPKQINTRLGTFGEVALRGRAEGRRPDPAHGLQGLPGLGGGQGREATRTRRPRSSRSRWPTSCGASTGSGPAAARQMRDHRLAHGRCRGRARAAGRVGSPRGRSARSARDSASLASSIADLVLGDDGRVGAEEELEDAGVAQLGQLVGRLAAPVLQRGAAAVGDRVEAPAPAGLLAALGDEATGRPGARARGRPGRAASTRSCRR